MRSMQMADFGAPLVETRREAPEPRGAEVLLRTQACGVCHSDLHLWDGFFDLGDGERIDVAQRFELPFTLGHEIVGEVVALGPDADGVAPGDVRLAHTWIGCSECPTCRDGDERFCARPRFVGTWIDGGYSDHVVIPHPRYLIDIGDTPPAEACVYACSGLTAFSALNKVLPLDPGHKLLVIGVGGLGLIAIQLARALGAENIVAADIGPDKRQAALDAGANAVIDAADPGALKETRRISDGGPQAAIDFVGSAQSARFGFDALRRGGSLVIVGLYGGKLNVPIPLFPLRTVNILSSFVGTLDEMRELMELVKSGQLDRPRVQTRPLAEVNEALADLRTGRVVGRIVLEP